MADTSSSQLHIEHYRELLEVEFDPDRREIVARLLKEAEDELRKSSDATAARKSGEDQSRLADNATAAAETFLDRERRADMSDEEKLQKRIDDQMGHAR